jgi:phosphoglycerate kinase
MQQHIDSYDFSGKKAIVRVDFNVPLNEKFEITDDTRIRRAMPTLKKILEKGGSLIIMSHLGRPKNVDPKKGDEKFSLKHIVAHVSECLGVPVKFVPDCMEADDAAKALKPGEAILLENLRYYAEEEGKPRGLAEDASEEETKAAKAKVKESQKEFTKHLASYADCYVNDAFGTAHRAHASTALIAKYFPNDKMFGYLMEAEIKAINNVLNNAKHPFTAIIGGSKVSSKLAVLKNMLNKVDNLIIGGGMGYTFIKAQGGHIGDSLHEDDLMPDALEILKEAKEKGVNVSLSVATVAGDKFANDANTQVVDIHNIPDGWQGMDASPASLENWRKIIMASKTILWNGPVGVFEMPNFAKGTLQIAQDLADATAQGAYTLVGGGDSVAAVTKMGFADKVSYVSTGGGAMLEAIEGKTLPGIAAIEED